MNGREYGEAVWQRVPVADVSDLPQRIQKKSASSPESVGEFRFDFEFPANGLFLD